MNRASDPAKMPLLMSLTRGLIVSCVLLAGLNGDSARGETLTVDPSAGRFRTISAAAAVVKPGDQVVVKPGHYRENIRLSRSGTKDAPIVFRAETPGTVVITGADRIPRLFRVEGSEPIYGVPWPHVFAIDHRDGKPVEHHPDSAPIWGRAEQVIADGKHLLPCKDLADLRLAWKFKEARAQPPLKNLGPVVGGMFAVDTRHHVLYLWLTDGSDPNKHTIEAATRSQIFGVSEFESKSGVQFVEAHGFIFRYAANFPQRAAVVLHGSNNTLANCIIEQMSGRGVSVSGVMRNCLIRGNGHTGGAAAGDDFLVEHCVWENNCWKPIDRGWESGGVKLCDSRKGEFRNCIFYRNGGPGLWLDIDVRDVVIRDCAMIENELSGLFIEISQSIHVENNHLARNAIGAVGKTYDDAWSAGGIQIAESIGCIIRNNLCFENRDGITLREIGPRPVKICGEETIFHTRGHEITGNTILNNREHDLALWWDNDFFGPHPAHPDKSAGSDPVYDPRMQQLTIDGNTYGNSAHFLYGAPWRGQAKKSLARETFAEHTGFEIRSDATERNIPPYPIERLIGEYVPISQSR